MLMKWLIVHLKMIPSFKKLEVIHFSFTGSVKADSLFYAMKTPIIAYFFACNSAKPCSKPAMHLILSSHSDMGWLASARKKTRMARVFQHLQLMHFYGAYAGIKSHRGCLAHWRTASPGGQCRCLRRLSAASRIPALQ